MSQRLLSRQMVDSRPLVHTTELSGFGTQRMARVMASFEAIQVWFQQWLFRLTANMLRQVHMIGQSGSGIQIHVLPVRHLRNFRIKYHQRSFHRMANLLHHVRLGGR